MKSYRQSVISCIEKNWIIVTSLAMVSAFALAIIMASGQSIWFDEGYSILVAKRSVSDVLALTAVDAHPPFYYLYLKAWGSTFGWGEFSLRSSSALLGAASVGMVVVLLRRLFSTKIALAVLPVVVIAPFFIRYNYEVRMYALVTLIGLIATWTLIRATATKDKRWWGLYAGMVALGMYTLYMSLAIWLAHGVWVIVRTLQSHASIKAVAKQPIWLALVVAVVLFVPQLPTFINQMVHSALPGVGSQVTLDRLVGIVGLITSYRPNWEVNGWLSIALITLFVVGGSIYVKIWHYAKSRQKDALLLVSLLVVVPVIFFALTSLGSKPIFIDRYMAHVVIYSYILLGLIAAFGWSVARRSTVIIYIIVLASLLGEGVLHLQKTGNFNLERMQSPMTAEVLSATRCDDLSATVVADDMYTYIDSAYYFGDCNFRFYSQTNADMSGGYAPLRDNPARVASSADVAAPTLVHLRWLGAAQSFYPSANYTLVQSQIFDKQVVDTYRRT